MKTTYPCSSAFSLIFTLFFFLSPALADDLNRGIGIDCLTELATEEKMDTELAELARLGANTLRLQYYNPSVGDDDFGEAEYRDYVENTVIPHLRVLLPKMAARSMKAVIALHNAPGDRVERDGQPFDRTFELPWAPDLLVDLWGQIAAEFNSNDSVLGYQVFSEPAPADTADWHALAQRLVDAVRQGAATAPKRIYLMPIYGNPDLIGTAPPINGSDIYLAANIYFPRAYTAQGLINNRTRRYKCTGFRKLKPRQRRLARREKVRTRNHIRRLRNAANKLGKSVMITEYSVVKWAPGAKCYLRDVTRLFDRYKFDSLYHIWKESCYSHLGATNEQGTCVDSETETDRYQTIERYFGSNT